MLKLVSDTSKEGNSNRGHSFSGALSVDTTFRLSEVEQIERSLDEEVPTQQHSS